MLSQFLILLKKVINEGGVFKSPFRARLKNVMLNDTVFTAVDLELTSLDPSTTDITSIGYVSGLNNKVKLSSCGYHVINTTADLGQSPVIHGLTHDVLEQGIMLDKALSSLCEAIQGSVLVFHNASLDLKALDKVFRDYKFPPLDVVYIDTLQLALYQLNKQHQVLPNNSATLTVCRQRLDLPSFPEHNALDDALATLQLFFAQLQQLGVNSQDNLSVLLHTKAIGRYTLGRDTFK
ncbi:3'-5' exonuclease [Alteromonas sp. KUL42]|nr:3'-5' exonuclease [Alteromonas sp. KUL42]TAP33562.1 3'-5' exonuclease [Alteromonas sp. KUL42]